MSLTLHKGLEPEWFIPESQKEESNPVQFKIAPMKSRQYVIFATGIDYSDGDTGEPKVSFSERSINIALKQVKGWKNVNDENGESIAFTRSRLDDIPNEIMFELIGRIAEISHISEEEEKN